MRYLTALVLLCGLSLLSACNEERALQDQISEKILRVISTNNSPGFAVYQVREQGRNYDTDLSLYWKEKTEQALIRIPGIRVVTRGRDLDVLLEEQRLILAGITDGDELARELEDLLSARYILNATLLHTGNQGLQLHYRLLDTGSGTVILSETVELPPKWTKQSQNTRMREFPGSYYDRELEVKARIMGPRIDSYRSKNPGLRLFSAVVSDQPHKTAYESYTEKLLSQLLLKKGYAYQPNLLGDKKCFPSKAEVHKSLYNPLYGEAPTLILLLSSREDQDTVRVSWELCSHGVKGETLFKDEIVIEK